MQLATVYLLESHQIHPMLILVDLRFWIENPQIIYKASLQSKNYSLRMLFIDFGIRLILGQFKH